MLSRGMFIEKKNRGLLSKGERKEKKKEKKKREIFGLFLHN